MNADWHRDHRLARNARIGERVAWHLEHEKACGCRPIPERIHQAIRKDAREKDKSRRV